jgi:hypothetical protein
MAQACFELLPDSLIDGMLMVGIRQACDFGSRNRCRTLLPHPGDRTQNVIGSTVQHMNSDDIAGGLDRCTSDEGKPDYMAVAIHLRHERVGFRRGYRYLDCPVHSSRPFKRFKQASPTSTCVQGTRSTRRLD